MCLRRSARNFAPAMLPNTPIEIDFRRIGMSRNVFALILAAFAAVATSGCEGGRLSLISASQAQSPQVQASNPAPARALPDFSALVEQNGAAVVNISTTAKVQVQEQDLQ